MISFFNSSNSSSESKYFLEPCPFEDLKVLLLLFPFYEDRLPDCFAFNSWSNIVD